MQDSWRLTTITPCPFGDWSLYHAYIPIYEYNANKGKETKSLICWEGVPVLSKKNMSVLRDALSSWGPLVGGHHVQGILCPPSPVETNSQRKESPAPNWQPRSCVNSVCARSVLQNRGPKRRGCRRLAKLENMLQISANYPDPLGHGAAESLSSRQMIGQGGPINACRTRGLNNIQEHETSKNIPQNAPASSSLQRGGCPSRVNAQRIQKDAVQHFGAPLFLLWRQATCRCREESRLC